MKVLYAGDSPIGGPANYLLGILKFLKADFRHLPPSKVLKPRLLRQRYDVIILSDFSRSHVSPASQKLIAKQVSAGAGLLMIGGWGSFSGPFGGWQGSLIEKLLPVRCLGRDDRVNFPGGAHLVLKKKHPMFHSLPFKDPPVICGLNQIQPRRKSLVLLKARRIVDRKEYPLLVVDADPQKRIVALAADLAPHWSGGLVDWGKKHVKIRVKGKIRIEVGEKYLQFVSSLLKWLARARSREITRKRRRLGVPRADSSGHSQPR